MDALQELVLELTDWCPLHCRHCSSNSGPCRQNRLRKEIVADLVNEAAILGAGQVSFGGGEPTASPLFVRTLRQVSSLGLLSEVYTCGVGLAGERVQPLCGNMISSVAETECVKFIFSIHGPSADVHDQITDVPGSFDCLRASLGACLAAGIQCEANFVPLQPNANHLGQVVDFVRSMGLEKLSVLRFVPQGRGLIARDQLELNRRQEDALVECLLDLRQTTDVEIRTGSPFNGIIPGNVVLCRAGEGKVIIQADGNVLPCEVFKHDNRRTWGLSVYEQSLRKILRSPQLQKLRATLRRAECVQCPVHQCLRTTQRAGGSDNEEVPRVAVQAQ